MNNSPLPWTLKEVRASYQKDPEWPTYTRNVGWAVEGPVLRYPNSPRIVVGNLDDAKLLVASPYLLDFIQRIAEGGHASYATIYAEAQELLQAVESGNFGDD